MIMVTVLTLTIMRLNFCLKQSSSVSQHVVFKTNFEKTKHFLKLKTFFLEIYFLKWRRPSIVISSSHKDFFSFQSIFTVILFGRPLLFILSRVTFIGDNLYEIGYDCLHLTFCSAGVQLAAGNARFCDSLKEIQVLPST